jgi:hypothetical protein
MAGKKVFQCVGPSYWLADKKAAVQRSVNCYPQRLAANAWMMAPTPGEVQIADLSGPFIALLGAAGTAAQGTVARVRTVPLAGAAASALSGGVTV